MATAKEYLDFIVGQFSSLQEVTFRMMMGAYLLYYKGKIFGGIYDNRLLVKPVEAAKKLIAEPVYEEPYSGAKPMILVESVDNPDFLCSLVQKMYPELPEPKKKVRRERCEPLRNKRSNEVRPAQIRE